MNWKWGIGTTRLVVRNIIKDYEKMWNQPRFVIFVYDDCQAMFWQ